MDPRAHRVRARREEVRVVRVQALRAAIPNSRDAHGPQRVPAAVLDERAFLVIQQSPAVRRVGGVRPRHRVTIDRGPRRGNAAVPFDSSNGRGDTIMRQPVGRREGLYTLFAVQERMRYDDGRRVVRRRHDVEGVERAVAELRFQLLRYFRPNYLRAALRGRWRKCVH